MIRELRDDERAWANERYRVLDFAPSPAEAFALVAELEDERIGLGRLVELEPGVIELGGIWTDERARGRGIARAMVTALLERAAGKRLWCLPFAHLREFYESFGFAGTPEPWPAQVAAKLSLCAKHPIPTGVVLVREATAR